MRVCFRSAVDMQHLAAYKAAHAAVWPEMLRALKQAGWNDYTLHLGADGLLIGFVECDDLDAARARMALTEVNAKWQAEMARLFPASDSNPDEGFMVMEEVFNLDEQLAAAGNEAEGMNK
ncbi:L-rhamnose mutarotase [Arthrobacter alpinus]|uniref:L-rhamnose mutarotase n=1 Tax=Arthrobacter alpinus TaxID=656366 RepID=A0A0U3RPS2_9MICC|nr:L-rhamnose mutarotase [Arthrobacter alpinus]ALV47025.1 L-rhamnose 1-epimerase [Arthrobacter alpinus]SEE88194.1 L-rhamnose mutarotase [Arthrobacter alpinus]